MSRVLVSDFEQPTPLRVVMVLTRVQTQWCAILVLLVSVVAKMNPFVQLRDVRHVLLVFS